MQAKDEELNKVKEKHLYAEQKLRDVEEQQQLVNLEKPHSQLTSFSVPCQETGPYPVSSITFLVMDDKEGTSDS